MAENTKSLAEIKRFLERKLEEIRREEEIIKTLLKMVDEALSSQSFVKASELSKKGITSAELEKIENMPSMAVKEPSISSTIKSEELEEPIQILTISSRMGEQLARMFVYHDRIVIKFTKTFHITTQPFQAFFVKKVLEGFKRKDDDLVAQGIKMPGETFDYQIVDENGVLKEVIIKNYGSKDNITEIKNTLRWTLNKMLQRENA